MKIARSFNCGEKPKNQSSPGGAADKIVAGDSVATLRLKRDTLPREQLALPIQPAGEAAQFFVRGQHAMAGNQNRNRVRAAGAADGPNGLRFANGAGDFTVTFGLAAGDFSQGVPNLPLKRCAAG